MLISFKDIQSLPGPLGQVVDGTQNANSHMVLRSLLMLMLMLMLLPLQWRVRAECLRGSVLLAVCTVLFCVTPPACSG